MLTYFLEKLHKSNNSIKVTRPNLYFFEWQRCMNLKSKFFDIPNFFLGGKSAIMTGMLVGLGGKAATTNRGNSLKGFIKDECKWVDLFFKRVRIYHVNLKSVWTFEKFAKFGFATTYLKFFCSLLKIITMQLASVIWNSKGTLIFVWEIKCLS